MSYRPAPLRPGPGGPYGPRPSRPHPGPAGGAQPRPAHEPSRGPYRPPPDNYGGHPRPSYRPTNPYGARPPYQGSPSAESLSRDHRPPSPHGSQPPPSANGRLDKTKSVNADDILSDYYGGDSPSFVQSELPPRIPYGNDSVNNPSHSEPNLARHHHSPSGGGHGPPRPAPFESTESMELTNLGGSRPRPPGPHGPPRQMSPFGHPGPRPYQRPQPPNGPNGGPRPHMFNARPGPGHPPMHRGPQGSFPGPRPPPVSRGMTPVRPHNPYDHSGPPNDNDVFQRRPSDTSTIFPSDSISQYGQAPPMAYPPPPRHPYDRPPHNGSSLPPGAPPPGFHESKNRLNNDSTSLDTPLPPGVTPSSELSIKIPPPGPANGAFPPSPPPPLAYDKHPDRYKAYQNRRGCCSCCNCCGSCCGSCCAGCCIPPLAILIIVVCLLAGAGVAIYFCWPKIQELIG
ncbi:hypothetical protein H4R34_003325 [Dimargaris verticillata]|uniref:Uncharacterized protein n=1 Tax=Dimargaris verticillata TaxID=2761393 RepID=A0A9W8E959_9FUNG|nr:hypothetical protein H4R34_003325 [Dimargaris verticillata]